ncbi:MAG: 16S rRNA (guanine(966)-N(2))-methyltransferase RsmD [Elusimicrobia bacterium CG08_land_8_20_14_0_20_44_26]|nr:MAG: 16S rRNA (guanine(966)-N(2))-methyltransferase RsmD [Elusimicrobia bacterium CG08_land_8_20_14_0_20_44_26]
MCWGISNGVKKNAGLSVGAGIYRGLRIESPVGIRPLTGLCKKSLFDILKPIINNCSFLDLFAGSGSVGIEALSRGASNASFVEKSPAVYEILKINLERLKIPTDKYSAYNMDSAGFLKTHAEKHFDIIFAGPPYSLVLENDFYASVMGMLKKNGIFICQHSTKKEWVFSGRRFRRKKYGITTIDFYKWGK